MAQIFKRKPMAQQDPNLRSKNFEEVALGYTKEEAVEEAKRCLQCKRPLCVTGCPVSVKIPEFIKSIADEDFEKSIKLLKENNSLPAVCGRVCPQEDQCEQKCILSNKGEAVAIGNLERFIADYDRKNNLQKVISVKKSNGKKVAVIGSGPAGLTVAGELIKEGFSVTIFEALHEAGGVLIYGIPEFRLPKNIVKKEIGYLESLGVHIEKNFVVGKTATIDELLNEENFDFVFIGSGAGLPSFMNIPGENSIGVYSANEYLTRSNLMKAFLDGSETPIIKGKHVVTIGGGNVAMDSARTAVRLGAETSTIVYRRTESEMPARNEEIHHAKEEGVIFKLLCNPTKINSDDNGFVSSIECVQMELGAKDSSGRPRPIVIENSNFQIDADVIIIAIGNKPNPIIQETTPDLKISEKGTILVNDDYGRTSKKYVYAGGDIVTGAATVILAMGAGRRGAKSIMEDAIL